jgi:hypothetical protein
MAKPVALVKRECGWTEKFRACLAQRERGREPRYGQGIADCKVPCAARRPLHKEAGDDGVTISRIDFAAQIPEMGFPRRSVPMRHEETGPMADHDPLDTNFLIFVIVAFVLIAGFAFTIFPHHEATTAAAPITSMPQKK